MFRRILMAFSIGFIFGVLSWVAFLKLAVAEGKKPAILILMPNAAWPPGDWDFDLLRELENAGFEIDYTDEASQLTWELLKNFNCLVIREIPHPQAPMKPYEKPTYEGLKSLCNEFLRSGGGIFLAIDDVNSLAATWMMPQEFFSEIGAKLPREFLYDPGTEMPHPRLPLQSDREMAFTSQILPSPVSDGVRGLWYPLPFTAPIEVSNEWIVVVKGSPTSFSRPMTDEEFIRNFGHFGELGAIKGEPYRRREITKEPILVAIREFNGGRIALMRMFSNFHLRAGSKWWYDKVVWEKGMGNRPSDLKRLFINILRWLSEPSLQKGTLGGHISPPDRLIHPQDRMDPKSVIVQWADYPDAQENSLKFGTPPKQFKGFIGARTTFSSGRNTVAEYAKKAAELGLQFAIFLEDFEKLTPEKFEALRDECKKYSSEKLLLIPGWTMRDNIGHNIFIFGANLDYPPPSVLVGPNKKLLHQQAIDDKGRFIIAPIPSLTWILRDIAGKHNQLGYFNFRSSPGCYPWNVRLYGGIAVWFWEENKLIENLWDSFIELNAQALQPNPFAINIVHSVEAFSTGVRQGFGINYAFSSTLNDVPNRLAYKFRAGGEPHQYISTGPVILDWRRLNRDYWTYGGEQFVTPNYRWPLKIAVASDVGLSSIEIYDRDLLLYRFLPKGRKQFERLLELNCGYGRNIVMRVEDENGRVAISDVAYGWNQAFSPVWCSDRINNCGNYGIGHGPLFFSASAPANFPLGATWDGGPSGISPVIHPQGIEPFLDSDIGKQFEDRRPHIARPFEEIMSPDGYVFSAECAWTTPKEVPSVNPWHTLGPLVETPLFQFRLKHTGFQSRPVRATPELHWSYPERRGSSIAEFEGEIVFKKTLRVNQLYLFGVGLGNMRQIAHAVPFVVINDGNGNFWSGTLESFRSEFFFGKPGQEAVETLIHRGGYAALFAQTPSNAFAIYNLGEPLKAVVNVPKLNLNFNGAIAFYAPINGKQVKHGEKYSYRVLILNDPMDEEGKNGRRYEIIREFLGMGGGKKFPFELRQGKLLSYFGILDVKVQDGVVEIYMKKPNERLNIPFPVRIHGLNPRWSAGLFQIEGYTQGRYTNGKNVYKPIGVTKGGIGFATLYPDYSENTHIIVGHPIVADDERIAIIFAHTNWKPHEYWLMVNNPTDEPITTTIRQKIPLPDLKFTRQLITLQPGEDRILFSPKGWENLWAKSPQDMRQFLAKYGESCQSCP